MSTPTTLRDAIVRAIENYDRAVEGPPGMVSVDGRLVSRIEAEIDEYLSELEAERDQALDLLQEIHHWTKHKRKHTPWARKVGMLLCRSGRLPAVPDTLMAGEEPHYDALMEED